MSDVSDAASADRAGAAFLHLQEDDEYHGLVSVVRCVADALLQRRGSITKRAAGEWLDRALHDLHEDGTSTAAQGHRANSGEGES